MSPRRTGVVVIGGGQAGLAMSRCLTDRSIDHVVLERGRTANSWTTERWDSLRLLTPNWMTRLPGFEYRGADPDGYMTAAEVAAFLRSYERSFDAPIHHCVTVDSVVTVDDHHTVVTNDGDWQASAVVLATGACSNPSIPALSADVPDRVVQLSSIEYRAPDQLPDGGVLVVGASASGIQIADELARSGRDVTIAVGEHLRLPRSYRGMDVQWWMDAAGVLDERFDEVDDIARARRLPSLQLIGSPERRDLDLGTLSQRGVRLVGRIVGRSGRLLQCSGALAMACASADLKQRRLLDRFDDHARQHGLDGELGEPTRPEPITAGAAGLEVDLDAVATIVWATGFRPSYPMLDSNHLDSAGRLVHDGGVLSVPGMYVMGLPFMRRRKSAFLDGVGPDATDLTEHLVAQLAGAGDARAPATAAR